MSKTTIPLTKKLGKSDLESQPRMDALTTQVRKKMTMMMRKQLARYAYSLWHYL